MENQYSSVCTKAGLCTYVEEEVDEWVVAAVGHGEPVHAEPDNVDVWVPTKDIYSVLLSNNIFIYIYLLIIFIHIFCPTG